MAKNTKNLITYLISPELLEELACEPSYSRGVQYAEDGRVTNVRLEDDCIHAKVHGTHLYRVEL